MRKIQKPAGSVYINEGEETSMKTIRNWTGLIALAVCTLMPVSQAKEKTLYDRLGGKKAIAAVVDEFVGRVAADTRINSFFAAAAADPQRLASFKMKLVNQICQASGGPCKYMGKDMKTAHLGMGITGPQFDALVGDLVDALDKIKVGEKEKGELLGALGPMKSDIVEK
jgi:hemoglobin